MVVILAVGYIFVCHQAKISQSYHIHQVALSHNEFESFRLYAGGSVL